MRLSRARLFSITAALALAASVLAQGHGSDNIWAGPNGGPYLDVSANVGANFLYGLGFTGSRSIIANIEGGRPWNLHETLNAGQITADISDYVDGPYGPKDPGWGGNIGDFDRHATWVGHTLVGRGLNGYQQGIAYGASLWAGGIATEFAPHNNNVWGGSFNWQDDHAFIYPYMKAFVTGINGATADVSNSSWGFSEPTGSNVYAVSADGIFRQSHKIAVFSAGNSGDATNTVGGVGAGYNEITVGALSSYGTGFNHLAGFSSRGPNDYQGPDGFVPGVRARVDITAPGTDLILGFYGGATGGNWGSTNPNLATNLYSFGVAGTSFSSPITAASAALLVDVAKANGYTNAVDGRVMKSILLNSATKPGPWAGGGNDPAVGAWDNGETPVAGVVTTTQALDYNYGAGMLNDQQAYHQLVDGTTDVAGLVGGSVENIGWDYGQQSMQGADNIYWLPYLQGGSKFTATLNWFVNRTFDGYNGVNALGSDVEFTNLELKIFEMGPTGQFVKWVADSNAAYINTQHLYFDLPEDSRYGIAVHWAGKRYDLGQIPTTNEVYGLAWNSVETTPEPASLAALAMGGLALLRRRRANKA